MAGMTFSPMTMQAILASLPDIKKKQRRAEQLRGSQKEFKELAKKPGQGNYQPQQMGGLFPTVQQYQTDYGAMGNQMTGALGDYMMGRQAEGAEDEYSAAQASGLLGASQQMAGLDAGAQQQDERPSEDTLRLYMGMIGGPDMKDFLPKARGDLRTQSTHKLANGNLGIVTNDPNRPIIDTGVPFDYAVDVKTSEVTGRDYTVGKSGAGRGKRGEVTFEGMPAATGGTAGDFASADAAVAQREGGLNPNDAGRGVTNFGINKAANPDVDVENLTPEGAAQIRKERYWDAIDADNLPPAIREAAYDAAINMGVGAAKQLIAESQGDPTRFRDLREQRYNEIFDPSRHTDADRESWTKRNLATTGSGPAPAGTAAPAAAGSGIAIDPRQSTLTPGQKSAIAVNEAAQKDANKAAQERATTAQTSLGKLKDIAGPARNTSAKLRSSTALDRVLAGSVGSVVDALDSPLARSVFAMYDAEAAGVLQKISQIRSGAFMQGFQALVGQGAGQISNAEGTKIEGAVARLGTAQSKEDFIEALDEFETTMAQIERRLTSEAGGAPTGAAPGPASPAAPRPQYKLPPGFSIED